eukprot:6288233-Prymnesium_polylepis.1
MSRCVRVVCSMQVDASRDVCRANATPESCALVAFGQGWKKSEVLNILARLSIPNNYADVSP